MGHYVRGDVILAPVPFEERNGVKTRPALVVSTRENGDLFVCPISSRPPTDAPSTPIGLDEFSKGGLDLFSESFVLTAKVSTIRSGDVIGVKGRLTAETIAEIGAQVQLPDQRFGKERRLHKHPSRR
ncbi:MAG: type II toxin-antitoxin system PemK/MazF family toxin [Methanoregula sp.]|uniref:type II toxin-antitoxin system PemK/MazF family toxin n=1 Tax=Methanoregula sp. TaxID=2052170 RepID=UPI003BB17A24